MQSYNLINAHIITLNDSYQYANSLTIDNGKIISINSTNSSVPSIDLEGKTIIPGFIDAHFHLKNFGKRLEILDLKNIHSLDDIKIKIKNKLQELSHNEWLIGFGWDQNLWPNRQYPDSDFLNSIAPNNPIYLTRIDGHSAWINHQAIYIAQTSVEELKNIEGGTLINDCIAVDNSMHIFKNYLPKETKEQVKKWITIAINETVKRGITGVHDAWQDQTTVDAIHELIQENKFPIRCYGMLAGNDQNLLSEYFKNNETNSVYYTIRSVKAFIDGALGSRGAALHEPYCDDHNNCGLILISQEEFDHLAQQCHKNNFQLNTHAIGDRGNSYVLDCYANILGKNNDRRWRIEHAQMVADSDMYRFKDYNILPSMQPSHCTSDMAWLDERIGIDRLKLISRWQTFINLGLKIPGGSDCPIETGNPLFEFYAAVTRTNHQGLPEGGWQPQEKINSLNALKMFTTWAAYGGFDELYRGRIDIGFDADLTVLSNNILDIEPAKILDIEILYTIINGKIVYKN